MATIEAEPNTKIRKSLIGRFRPLRGDYVPGDAENYWIAGLGVHQSQGHWKGHEIVIGVERSILWISHGARAIKCAREQEKEMQRRGRDHPGLPLRAHGLKKTKGSRGWPLAGALHSMPAEAGSVVAGEKRKIQYAVARGSRNEARMAGCKS